MPRFGLRMTTARHAQHKKHAPIQSNPNYATHRGSKIIKGTVACGSATTPKGKMGSSLSTRGPLLSAPPARGTTDAPLLPLLVLLWVPRRCCGHGDDAAAAFAALRALRTAPLLLVPTRSAAWPHAWLRAQPAEGLHLARPKDARPPAAKAMVKSGGGVFSATQLLPHALLPQRTRKAASWTTNV